MGITNIFDVATSGIMAQRAAMEVTSENVSNVNTPGYSRQRIILESRSTSVSGGQFFGTGVVVASVQRSYDEMLQNQIVNGNSTYQQNLTRQQALQQIEPSFNEVASDGLGKAVDNFFDAWTDVSVNASGTPERQALLSQTQVMTDTFHQMNTTLNGIKAASDTSLTDITADITDNAKNIANLNYQILTAHAAGANTNELMDQRDQYLQELAGKVGVISTEQTDGTVTVSLPGGQKLVSSNQYSTVYTNHNAKVPPTNDIYVTDLGNPPPYTNPLSDKNVTATIGGTANSQGSIGGTLQVRDAIVPGYLAKLDEMANRLVTAVNAQHQQGYALDGTTGNNFFDPAGVTSATISLAAGVTTTKIAAGFPTASDPAPTSPSNNLNALSLAAIKSNAIGFSSGKDTFDGFYNSLVSKVGIDVQAAQNITTQGESFLKQLNTLRESNSGVSLDEELTNLVKYQRAFEGSAKVINAGTDMLDTILGLIR